jgi:hypothetical protein
MHPLRNDFGSIAAIAAVLRQSPEAESYSAGAAQGWSASHEPRSHAFVVTRSRFCKLVMLEMVVQLK